MKYFSPLIFVFISIFTPSCRKDGEIIDLRLLSGGESGTVFDKSQNSFGHQMPGISDGNELLFFVGNSFFNQNWVEAPASTTARDGIGPLFNSKSCSACHFKDGRGKPITVNGESANGFLIRLSMDGVDENGGPLPHPIYGGQFNDIAVSGISAEGNIEVDFEYLSGVYEDGTVYVLRKPIYSLTNLNYGPIGSDVKMSPRVGQQMIGLGLLDAIDEEQFLQLSDEFDSDSDGISGKINYVWDIESQSLKVGVFGWKASEPSVKQQVAGAFKGDLSIKSSLFPNENYTENQTECSNLPDGGTIEIEDDDLMKTVIYSSSLAVPARRNIDNLNILKGESIFNTIDCAKCHIPNLVTGASHEFSYLNNQLIHPYTDLLLHDMGQALSDDTKEFDAEGQEWRTQPLWGIGLINIVNGHTYFLHDGRARNIEEAILWHGGEAEDSKQKFKSLTQLQRNQLIEFINSL